MTVLYRPIGSGELALVEASGWKAFPPTQPGQPRFHSMTSEACARQIAQDWSDRHDPDGLGFVTRFVVPDAFLARYESRPAAGGDGQEYRLPASDIGALNAAIEGRIEIIGAYGVSGDSSDLVANFDR